MSTKLKKHVTTPMLFCNVGWMKDYDGSNGDPPTRGGEYNKHSTGHEACNFTKSRGQVFGYVQAAGQIKIERLGASKNDEFIDGVTVVWTAGPEDGGTVVVGWYKEARVYRHGQQLVRRTQKHVKDNITTYRIVADEGKAFLLPVEERYDLYIPRAVKGGIGQNAVWYADQEESRMIREKVARFIHDGTWPVLDLDERQHSALEGNKQLVTHLRRERRRELVEKKRRATLRATGKLCCEACGFDFKVVYGHLGSEFCEVHHRVALKEAISVVTTTLEDLAVLCSNCHRIIHRSDPMLTVEVLAKHIKRQRRLVQT